MGHQITALLGIVEPTIEELITDIIRHALPAQATLAIRDVCTLSEIEDATAEGNLDLAVLFLNNLIAPNAEERVASALAGVRHLASRGIPVISLCGWTDARRVANLASAAGSKFHFPSPFDVKLFEDAVRQCLSRFVQNDNQYWVFTNSQN